jgi:hypothetical protein
MLGYTVFACLAIPAVVASKVLLKIFVERLNDPVRV